MLDPTDPFYTASADDILTFRMADAITRGIEGMLKRVGMKH
jgi:hypothetical protein